MHTLAEKDIMKATIGRGAVALLCAATMLAGTRPLQAQEDGRVVLGPLANHGTVFFTRGADGWGIHIDNPGRSSMMQADPVQLRMVVDTAAGQDLAAGYDSLTWLGAAVVGHGHLSPRPGVTVEFEDRWSVAGQVLSLKRNVAVRGSAPGGFASAIALSTVGGFTFSELDLFLPGMFYSGYPEHIFDRAPGGLTNFLAGHIQEREDGFTMPVFGFSFRDGSSIAVLDPKPDGSTVMADTQARRRGFFAARGAGASRPRPEPVINEKMRFGGMGVFQNDAGGVDVAYWFPGTLPNAERYHPFRDGLTQSYSLEFRFGENETFHDFYRNAWRWGWKALAPKPDHYDLSVVQRSLVDQLVSIIVSRKDWSGLPFQINTITGKVVVDSVAPCSAPTAYCDEKPGEYRWSRAIMGFVGKNIESASEILYDSYGDSTARGTEDRQKAIAVINSFARKVKVDPPNGSGFNVETGEPSMTNPEGNHVTCCSGRVYLREFAEDMRWGLRAYQWEKERGHTHADWLDWMTRFADWALTQQAPDGSFPRSFYVPSGEVRDSSTTSGYFMVDFLVALSKVTSQPRYLDAAKKAADFVWVRYQRNDHFIGGPIDNPNGMDKEAGTLSLAGYLALYQATGEAKWLRYAKAAGDYSETWMYAWNVPMPADANPDSINWKPGVPTLGVSRINSGSTGVDQWMAANPDEYAMLYKYTGDRHYLDVARVLLHGTKSMMALPGRTYDVVGPGWQQEHWSMTLGRGFANHRNEFPWVSANQLNGIIGLKIFDASLYRELAGPAPTSEAH